MPSHWALQAVDVAHQLFLGGALRRGADDDARVFRQVVLEDLLQAVALGIGKLAGDAGHRAARHVDQVASRQGDLGGQAGTLVAPPGPW